MDTTLRTRAEELAKAIASHPIGKPELSEIVVPAAVVRVALNSVASFRLINPEPNRRYDCRWRWGKEELP